VFFDSAWALAHNIKTIINPTKRPENNCFID
jgi:hypothetical protein